QWSSPSTATPVTSTSPTHRAAPAATSSCPRTSCIHLTTAPSSSIAKINKNVMSSVAEAELGDLYIMVHKAIWIRVILEELGHKQPPTLIQTDNSTTAGIINNTVQPKQTKAIDRRFHWLRDRKLDSVTSSFSVGAQARS
ncbi:hypothetical protein THAOC_20267, partial [Thalassiosira oceanica]